MTGSQFFEGLDSTEVREVLAAAHPRRLASQEVIYEQGSPAGEFFLLTKGRGHYFYISPDGRKMLLHWLVPGDVLGSATLLQHQSHYRISVETIKDSSAMVWDRATIQRLLERYPRLCHNALSITVTYLDWYIATHAALVSDDARQRLASVLTKLVPTIGSDVAGGIELEVTNEELASAANITPFTASRILGEWQAGNLVTKRRGRIVVHSAERLFGKIA